MKDTDGDECTCFGAVSTSDLSELRHTSYHAGPFARYLYRCYSGGLYSKSAENKQKVEKMHPGGTIVFVLDCEKRTLALTINGAMQAITFSDVTLPL